MCEWPNINIILWIIDEENSDILFIILESNAKQIDDIELNLIELVMPWENFKHEQVAVECIVLEFDHVDGDGVTEQLLILNEKQILVQIGCADAG